MELTAWLGRGESNGWTRADPWKLDLEPQNHAFHVKTLMDPPNPNCLRFFRHYRPNLNNLTDSESW